MADNCNSNGNSLSAHRLLLLVLLFLFAYEAYAFPPVEQGVLLDMKQSWKDPTNALKTWIKGKDCSTWSGVTCDSNGKVIKIYLVDNKLSGAIPSSIGDLKSLLELALSSNRLSGAIPSSIGNLKSLQGLWMYNNQLSGAIPSSIGNLKKLKILYLSNNQLSGAIPSSIKNLQSLSQIYLHSNYFIDKSPISCSRYDFCILDDNCLVGVGSQRSSSQCSSFCKANSSVGPCEGHGVCAFNAKKKAVCTCEAGRVLPDCLTKANPPPPTTTRRPPPPKKA